jgi:hypothetical protein
LHPRSWSAPSAPSRRSSPCAWICSSALAAASGLDNAALAERLGKSRKTVNNQLTRIYEKLHEHLGFRDDVPTDRAVLAAELGPYFALEQRPR